MSLKELEASITSQLNERFNLELEVIKEVSIEEGIALNVFFEDVMPCLPFGTAKYWLSSQRDIVDAQPWDNEITIEACSVTNDFCSDEVRAEYYIPGFNYEEFFSVTFSHDDKETLRKQLEAAVEMYREAKKVKAEFTKRRIEKLENQLKKLKEEQASAK